MTGSNNISFAFCNFADSQLAALPFWPRYASIFVCTPSRAGLVRCRVDPGRDRIYRPLVSNEKREVFDEGDLRQPLRLGQSLQYLIRFAKGLEVRQDEPPFGSDGQSAACG
jgi:hypothetical protein